MFHTFVIPAQAGIHSRNAGGAIDHLCVWIPASAGMTRIVE
ncbi:hypothetical protein [Sphingomonas sp. A2-49]|nr:hypothetical protein [Sphingomonas sp. A2-49]